MIVYLTQIGPDGYYRFHSLSIVLIRDSISSNRVSLYVFHSTALSAPFVIPLFPHDVPLSSVAKHSDDEACKASGSS